MPRLSALLSQPVGAIPFVPVDTASSPIGRELLQQVEEAVADIPGLTRGSPVLLIAEEAAWEQSEKQILRITPAGLERVLDPAGVANRPR